MEGTLCRGLMDFPLSPCASNLGKASCVCVPKSVLPLPPHHLNPHLIPSHLASLLGKPKSASVSVFSVLGACSAPLPSISIPYLFTHIS